MKFLKFIKKIYDGEKSTVYQALDTRNNRQVICKENALMSELKIHSLLTHKNIIEMICGYKNKKCCLLMEYVEGMDLYDLIDIKRYLSEDEAYLIFTQMYLAVKYLHENKIVHRDIKPENILINFKKVSDDKESMYIKKKIDDKDNFDLPKVSDDKDNVNFKKIDSEKILINSKPLVYNIKLCDFGFATFFKENSFLALSCGSLGHAPPEILRGDPYIGPEVDIWCLGSCLYMMVTGVLPVRINEEISYPETFGYINEHINILSSDLKSLLRKLLDNNPKTRMTMEEIGVHPWVVSRKDIVKDNNDLILDNSKIQEQDKQYPVLFYSHVLDLMRNQDYDLENDYNIYKMIIVKISQGYSINEIFFLNGFKKYEGLYKTVQTHLYRTQISKDIKLDLIQPTCFISCFNRPQFSFRFQTYLSLNKINLEINRVIREHKLKVKCKIQLEFDSKRTGRIIHENGSIDEFKRLILILLNVDTV